MNVGEPQALRAQLLAKHPIFFLKVFDDVLLAAIEPSSEHREQKLKLQRVHPRERTLVAAVEVA
jgi:hypothetical protein